MSTNSSNRLQLTAAIAQNMIASRAIVKLTDVDQTRRFHIRGTGNIIPVTNRDGAPVLDQQSGQPLTKIIYGIKANSHVAMLNTRNREILKAAMLAETAGNVEEAHTLFNDYLNKIQVSFSVILNPGRKQPNFMDGQLVEGEIALITTDNGQLLTVNNVRAVAVEKLAATPAFSLNDLMGITESIKPEDVFQTIVEPVNGETVSTAAVKETVS